MQWLKSSHRALSEAFETTQSTCLWCLKEFNPEAHLRECLIETKNLCEACSQRLNYKPKVIKLGHVKVYSLYEYDTEFSRLLIQYKEMRDVMLAPLFVLNHEARIRKLGRFREKVLMPSSKSKLEERGFNHLQLMYQSVFKDLTSPFEKVSERKQVGLSKEERRQIEFKLIKPVKQRVLLLDDVITTGSTLCEAIRLLGDRDIVCFSLAYKAEPV